MSTAYAIRSFCESPERAELEMVRVRCLTILLFALPSTTDGQVVTRVSNDIISRALDESHRRDSRGASFKLSADGGAQFILNRRTEPSEIELHCLWDDLVIVRSGAGTLSYSAKLKGLTRIASWEWRAASLVQSANVTLTVGDIVRVPAGQGHRISPIGEAPLVYLVVKQVSPIEKPCGSLNNRGQ